jgi:putative transposase
MPAHVYLLLSEPKQGTAARALQMLKQRVSKKLRHDGESARLRSFWEPRFYDFNVYTRKKSQEKLHYIHANPILRGLVKHPKDWLRSSWGFY